jgi:hypothetical protein
MLTATQSKALDRVMQTYVIPDPDEVRTFLTERPRVAELLAEAIDVIPRYFGPDPSVKLLVSEDPEGDGPPCIVAFIRTTLLPEQSIDTIHRMEKDWYFAFPRALREEVLFNLNPVRA